MPMSLPPRPIVIAKINRNTPSLHRTLNIPDHLFNYVLKKERLQPIELLGVMMEEFDNLIKYNIDQVPIHRLAFDQFNKYCRLIDPECALSSCLAVDENTKEHILNPTDQNKHIYLCRQFITSLNENIGLLKDMEVMQLCCNYISRLPYSIKNLTKLRLIVLSRNRLVEIPDEIGMCRELRELDLSGNLLTTLPKTIAALKNLHTLYLGNNRISELPLAIGKITSLKTISFSNNPVTVIPYEILKLPFLGHVVHDGCNFQTHQSEIVEVGEMTMLEIIARYIIRNNCNVPKKISDKVKHYIMSVKECGFCGGPMFDNYFIVRDYQEHEGIYYPIEYKMCIKHYESHNERLEAMFKEHPETAPVKLQRDRMPNITELFEPDCHTDEQRAIAEETYDSSDDRVPLICLSLWNTRFYKTFNKEQKSDNYPLGWAARITRQSFRE